MRTWATGDCRAASSVSPMPQSECPVRACRSEQDPLQRLRERIASLPMKR